MANENPRRDVSLWNPFGEEFSSPERFFLEWSSPGQRAARLAENVLSIRGEKKSEREEKKDKTHWLERTYGSFSRSFTLPPSAVSEQLRASFKDGVLSIEIPKKEETKPRQISIK
jgi:HSP20 family protein